MLETDAAEIQVVAVESGFEPRNFGGEPAGNITVGMNGDANLALLNDGMNLNRAESVGADANMHLGVRGGIGGAGRGRRSRGSGWRRGVEHLMGFGKLGRGIRCGLGRSRGGGRRGRGQRHRWLLCRSEWGRKAVH